MTLEISAIDLLNLRAALKEGSQPRRAKEPICLLLGGANLLGCRNQPLLATEPNVT